MDLITNFIRLNGFIFCACNRDLITEYALVRTAGVGEENGDNEGTGSGCWMLDARYRFLVPGHFSLVPVRVACYGLRVYGRQ